MATTVLQGPDTRMAELRGNRASEAPAAAIKAVSDLGLYVDQKVAEANLERDITTEVQVYTNETDTGNAGPQAVLEDTNYVTYGGLRMDVAENPQYVKALEETRRRLSREKSALAQGVRSTLAFQARVENITREAIAKRPGLRRELTAVAAGVLGFDPTGTQLRNLMREATAEKESSAFEKGRDEARKARGKAYEIAMRANPSGNEETWLRAADAFVNLESDRVKYDNEIQVYKNKAQLSEGEREVFVSAYGQKLDDALTAQMMLSDPISYNTQKGWDESLLAVNKQLDSALEVVRKELRSHPDWNTNPLAKADMEKKLQALETDKRTTIAKMSELWKASIDAKTGSINAALAQERFNALMTVKKALRPYPNLYELVMLGNFSVTNAALPQWMAGNETLGKAVNTLMQAGQVPSQPGSVPKNGTAGPAPVVRMNPSAQRADEEKRAYMSGIKGTDDQNLFYYSGALRQSATLFSAKQPNEDLERRSGKEIGKLLNEGVNALFVPGGGYTPNGGRTVQFSNVEAFSDNPKATRPEEAVIDIAVAVANNPSKLQFVDSDGLNKLATGLNTARTVYHDQLTRNSTAVTPGGRAGNVPVAQLIKPEVRKGADGRPLLSFVPNSAGSSYPTEQSKALVANNALASRWNKVLEAQWHLHPEAHGVLVSDIDAVASSWGSN